MAGVTLDVTWVVEAADAEAVQARLACRSIRVEEVDTEDGADADDRPAGVVVLPKPAAGGRCTARVGFPETYEVRRLEVVSSARTVEVYAVGDGEPAEEVYWETTRGTAAEDVSPAPTGGRPPAKLWRCAFDFTPDSAARKPLRKAKKYITLKCFSMSPATSWTLHGVTITAAPYEGPPTPPKVAMENPALEQLMGLAVKFMGGAKAGGGGMGLPLGLLAGGLGAQAQGGHPQLPPGMAMPAAIAGCVNASADVHAHASNPPPPLPPGVMNMMQAAAAAAAPGGGVGADAAAVPAPSSPSPQTQREVARMISDTSRNAAAKADEEADGSALATTPPRTAGGIPRSGSPLIALAAAAQRRREADVQRAVHTALGQGSPMRGAGVHKFTDDDATKLARVEQRLKVVEAKVLGREATKAVKDDRIAMVCARLAVLEGREEGSPVRGGSASPPSSYPDLDGEITRVGRAVARVLEDSTDAAAATAANINATTAALAEVEQTLTARCARLSHDIAAIDARVKIVEQCERDRALEEVSSSIPPTPLTESLSCAPAHLPLEVAAAVTPAAAAAAATATAPPAATDFLTQRINDVAEDIVRQDNRLESLLYELAKLHHTALAALSRRVEAVEHPPSPSSQRDNGKSDVIYALEALAAYTPPPALPAKPTVAPTVVDALRREMEGRFEAVEAAMERAGAMGGAATNVPPAPLAAPVAPAGDGSGQSSSPVAAATTGDVDKLRAETNRKFEIIHTRLDALEAQQVAMREEYDARFAVLDARSVGRAVSGVSAGVASEAGLNATCTTAGVDADVQNRLLLLEADLRALSAKACPTTNVRDVHQQVDSRLKWVERAVENLTVNLRFSEPSPQRRGGAAPQDSS